MAEVKLSVNVEKTGVDNLEKQVNSISQKGLKLTITGATPKVLENYSAQIKKLTNAAIAEAEADRKLKLSKDKANIARANARAEQAKAAAQAEKTAASVKASEARIQAEQEKTTRSYEKTKRAAISLEETKVKLSDTSTREAEAAAKTATAHAREVAEVEKTRRALLKHEEQLNKTTKANENFFASMLKAKAVSLVVQTITSQFKEALETMKAVDTELVTIRKVTGASDERIDAIRQAAYSTASKYGESAAGYLGAVASFSRAGYGDLAESLAELATKTQLVGDVDQETAVQFLLSTDAAYKYKGSVADLTKVLDGANEIDNKYATSIQKIAEGMGLVAPVAAQVNVTESELAAAIGTITAVTQRSGTEAARALRSLFLNIIGDTTTEIEEGVTATEESVTSLRNLLKRYAPEAVAAAEATGKIIDPMEAIAALSKAMQDGLLTEQQLMESLSSLGGKLRITQLVSLVQNYSGMYTDMLHDYSNAVGSADREVENALNSWERKTQILKNTWTEFVSKSINVNAIKGLLDVLTGILKTVGSLGNALAIVASIVVSIKLPSIVDLFEKLGGGISKLRTALEMFTNRGGEGGMLGFIRSTLDEVGSLQLGIMGLTAVISIYMAIYRKWQQSLIEATDAAIKQSKESANEYKNTQALRQELKEADDAYANGTISKEEYLTVTGRVAEALGLEKNAISQARQELDRLSEEQRQHAIDDARYAMGRIGVEVSQSEHSSAAGNVYSSLALRRFGFNEATTDTERMEAAAQAVDYLKDRQRELQKAIQDGTATWSEQNIEYEENAEAIDFLTKKLAEYNEQVEILNGALGFDNAASGGLSGALKTAKEEADGLTDSIEEATNALEDFTNATSTELDEQFQKYVSAYKQFLEDWEAGFKGSNAVKAAAELFFTDEQINDLRAKGMNVGEILSNDFYKGIFSAEGKDRGAVFLGQLWDHFGSEIVSNGELAATLTKTGDSIGIVVEDVDALADALYNLTGLGFTPEFLESWMSALGMYSEDINVSADALMRMAQGFGAVSESGVVSLQGMLAGLREQFGDNTNAIWDYVDALIAASERGDIQLDLGADTVQEARDKIRDALNDVQEGQEAVEEQPSTVDITETGYEEVVTKLDRLRQMASEPVIQRVVISSPRVATHAAGTMHAPGGLSIVNEEGPEIIAEGNQLRIAGGGQPTLTWLQPGAAVLTAGETRSALGGLDPAFFFGGIRAYALGTRIGSSVAMTDSGRTSLNKIKQAISGALSGLSATSTTSAKAAKKQTTAVNTSASLARQYTAPIKATNSSGYGGSSGGSSGGSGGGGGYSSGGGGGGGSSSSSKSDSTLDGLKNIVSLRKSELSLLQAKDASVKDQINKEREIQDALKNQINYMVSIGGNQEEINKLWAEWYKINDDIAKLMKDMFKDVSDAAGREIDKLEKARDKELEVLDAQLDAMQAERDAKSDQLDYEEKLLAVEEARANLEKAMNGERTVRMWNAATGQWEHTYDAKTVASAQQAYDDALKALADYEDQMAYDMEVAAIEAQKEAIKESYQTQVDGWQEIIDSLEEPAESMEAVLKRIAESAMPDMEATITNLNTLLAKFGYHIGAGGATYDSGGILGGLGGIKGTARPEMVLPPDITSKMLTPMSGPMFAQRMSELAYLYGGATPNGFAGMNSTSIGSVHNGSVFNLGGISMTAEQAKHTTVYDLARISRNLRAYNSTI